MSLNAAPPRRAGALAGNALGAQAREALETAPWGSLPVPSHSGHGYVALTLKSR